MRGDPQAIHRRIWGRRKTKTPSGEESRASPVAVELGNTVTRSNLSLSLGEVRTQYAGVGLKNLSLVRKHGGCAQRYYIGKRGCVIFIRPLHAAPTDKYTYCIIISHGPFNVRHQMLTGN